jgi:uncharacterized protein (UPF0276 family)
MSPASLDARVEPPIPVRAGIGLRAQHYHEVIETRPATGWFEVHSENYFGDGGPPLRFLERVRRDYPLSLHGVGLSLGSSDPLNLAHLQKLKTLITRFAPGLVSEHLCWSSIGGLYLNDLLPLPYTEEALRHVSQRILQTQDYLQRQILIENVSSYLQYRHSTIPEQEFVADVAARTGCGILLDVNNIYVSAINHDFDPLAYLHAIPVATVREIHLAGFAVNHYDDGDILIDHHGAPVAEPVWDLYGEALRRFGPTPTLIEWDTDIPPLTVLLDEARKADSLLERQHARVA